jgi:hypothetical protein
VDVESGNEIGKFSSEIRKLGTLQINVGRDKELYEQVLVSALAVVEARRRAFNANANANAPGLMRR